MAPAVWHIQTSAAGTSGRGATGRAGYLRDELEETIGQTSCQAGYQIP